MADVHDDDDHFKRRSSKPHTADDTGFEADIDSPISKTGERASPISLYVHVCVCAFGPCCVPWRCL